jgi:transposase
MTYSLDFRRKVLEVKAAEKLSCGEVASRFNIGIMSVVRWSKEIEPKRTRKKAATKIDREALKKDVEMYPDAYQHERAKRFNVSRFGIFYALKQLGITYKKNPKTPQSGQRKACYVLPRDR